MNILSFPQFPVMPAVFCHACSSLSHARPSLSHACPSLSHACPSLSHACPSLSHARPPSLTPGLPFLIPALPSVIPAVLSGNPEWCFNAGPRERKATEPSVGNHRPPSFTGMSKASMAILLDSRFRGNDRGEREGQREAGMPEGDGHARGGRACQRGTGMSEGGGHVRGGRACQRGTGMSEGGGHVRGRRACQSGTGMIREGGRWGRDRHGRRDGHGGNTYRGAAIRLLLRFQLQGG